MKPLTPLTRWRLLTKQDHEGFNTCIRRFHGGGGEWLSLYVYATAAVEVYLGVDYEPGCCRQAWWPIGSTELAALIANCDDIMPVADWLLDNAAPGPQQRLAEVLVCLNKLT